MQPDERDTARLWDMLTYAKDVGRTASRMTFETYMADDDRRLATERRLEIIGEAARNVSPSFQADHPEIPWRQIVALRNVLAHEYGEIRQERIFRIVTEHVPPLIKALEPLVPPSPEDDF